MQERVLKVACCVHRFLISGSDLGIDARFSRFTATCVHRFLISGPNLRINARISSFAPSFVHRFLISSPNLRIDARFSRFTATRVHRFLILGGQFGNRCMDCPETASLLQRFLISGPDLRITAAPSSQQCGMARLLRPSPQLPSASDSNFRCRKGEWFRLQRSWRQRFPRLILISVAAEKNGPPAAVVSATSSRVRF